MSFRSVFIAVVIAFALILGAFLINRARPRVENSLVGLLCGPQASAPSVTRGCSIQWSTNTR